MEFFWMALTAFVAYATGKRIILWTIGAYFFGWFALVVALFVPGKQAVADRRLASLNMLSDRLLNQDQSAIVKKEIQDFNTVDDLFKQLKTK